MDIFVDPTRKVNRKRANLLLLVDAELRESKSPTKINSLSSKDLQEIFTEDIFIECGNEYISSRNCSRHTSNKQSFKSSSDKNFMVEESTVLTSINNISVSTINRYDSKGIRLGKKEEYNEFLEYLRNLAKSLKNTIHSLKEGNKLKERLKSSTNCARHDKRILSTTSLGSLDLIRDLCDDFIKRYNNNEVSLNKSFNSYPHLIYEEMGCPKEIQVKRAKMQFKSHKDMIKLIRVDGCQERGDKKSTAPTLNND